MMRIAAVAAAAVALAACSSSDQPNFTGGGVQGVADTHCTLPDGGVEAQETHQSACVPTGGDAGVIDYGPTMYNSEADDDDCKYHVKFATTQVAQNQDVLFHVVATQKADGGVATGANVDIEAFLNNTHPAPNSGQHATEGPPGTYQVGPVRFDATGRWTVRFHLFETCADQAPDSPHGHAAFYLDVP